MHPDKESNSNHIPTSTYANVSTIVKPHTTDKDHATPRFSTIPLPTVTESMQDKDKTTEYSITAHSSYVDLSDKDNDKPSHGFPKPSSSHEDKPSISELSDDKTPSNSGIEKTLSHVVGTGRGNFVSPSRTLD